MDYTRLMLENTEEGLVLSQVECMKASRGGTEKSNESVTLKDNTVYLKVQFTANGDRIHESESGTDLLVMCQFSYSTDGKKFRKLGNAFQAKEGQWIGSKVGIFCTRPAIVINDGGWADVDWFRITQK